MAPTRIIAYLSFALGFALNLVISSIAKERRAVEVQGQVEALNSAVAEREQVILELKVKEDLLLMELDSLTRLSQSVEQDIVIIGNSLDSLVAEGVKLLDTTARQDLIHMALKSKRLQK